MNQPLKIAVVGIGGRGIGMLRYAILPACQDHPVEIAAVYDTYPERTQEGAKIVREATGKEPVKAESYQQILDDPEIAAVLITAAWEAHVDLALAAMRAGKEADPDFSLGWWHLMPLNEAGENFNYNCHYTVDYMLGRSVTVNCPDVELAVRFIEWQCSEEGSQLWSWGVEGKSYEVNADGNKQFIEGYDKTFFARFQTGMNVDMKATAATYSAKCQEMIFDTTDASQAGAPNEPTLVFTDEENMVLLQYQTDYGNCFSAYWQRFLLGDLELNDANWNQMISELNGYGAAEIMAVYNAAYQRSQAE